MALLENIYILLYSDRLNSVAETMMDPGWSSAPPPPTKYSEPPTLKSRYFF